jgi:hypothetical protein
MEEGTPSTLPKPLQTSPVEKQLEETPASILDGHKKIADFSEDNTEHQPRKSKKMEKSSHPQRSATDLADLSSINEEFLHSPLGNHLR